MPSVFSHAAVGLALGACFDQPEPSKRIWLLGAGCAVLPDLDVVGLWLGVPYASVLGHRGLSHSLTFAAAIATLFVVAWVRWGRGERGGGAIRSGKLWLYLFLATASHGVLDAMTNGGLGVAFFAPFEDSRYFLPFRPIQVSPLELARLFSIWGVTVFHSELLWIWLPSLVVVAAVVGWRRRRRREESAGGTIFLSQQKR